jgi:hypothetical protein
LEDLVMSRLIDRNRRWLRIARVLGLGIGCALLALGAGCNKKSTATRAAQVYVAPDWNSDSVTTLAYCGLGANMGDEVMRGDAERLVETELRGSQDRFVVLTMKNAESRAAEKGKTDLLNRVRQVWRDNRLIDKFLAKDLCAALGVDGLIVADVTDWTEQRIDVSQEGTSWTRAEMGVYVYSGESGDLVWGAQRSLRKDSVPYTPGTVPGDSGTRRDREERRAERAASVTPDPPEVEVVAHELMLEILGLFPPRS